jgi:hypothetical protein
VPPLARCRRGSARAIDADVARQGRKDREARAHIRRTVARVSACVEGVQVALSAWQTAVSRRDRHPTDNGRRRACLGWEYRKPGEGAGWPPARRTRPLSSVPRQFWQQTDSLGDPAWSLPSETGAWRCSFRSTFRGRGAFGWRRWASHHSSCPLRSLALSRAVRRRGRLGERN